MVRRLPVIFNLLPCFVNGDSSLGFLYLGFILHDRFLAWHIELYVVNVMSTDLLVAMESPQLSRSLVLRH